MAYSVFLPQLPPNVRSMPPRIPQASHRHASPSGPWPWADIIETTPYEYEDAEADEPPVHGHESPRELWTKYPTFFYPNWTRSRVERSGIARIIHDKTGSQKPGCMIYHVDIGQDGGFSSPAHHLATEGNKWEFWDLMQNPRPDGVATRALFVENLSGPVLQMLGTKYNIEPFFFSSSLNWIPSRYQEEPHPNLGDHITITLTFLRAMTNPMTAPPSPTSTGFVPTAPSRAGTATIDTQAPLSLRSNDKVLLIDLLAIHMIRRQDSSTMISYHPPSEWRGTSAQYLHSRVHVAGKSVYWRKIFRQSDDPTFVVLCILWYALYAWDEALEHLYAHICWLETRVIVTNDIHLTRELHIIRASLLHYASLLEDFRKSVVFVRTTPNPAMRDRANAEQSGELMDRECNALLSEIERLEMARKMQVMRLENVINLAFSSVNFQDSRDMQKLTEAALRDSAAMKQISYLTMVFLPATFIGTVFGMNIKELSSDTSGSLTHYIAAALPLTVLTIWIMMALHGKAHHEEQNISFWSRLQWPIFTLQRMFVLPRKKSAGDMV